MNPTMMNFFEALQELSQGRAVSRTMWNGTRNEIKKLVFQSEQTITDVKNIEQENRLPQAVKDQIKLRGKSAVFFGCEFSVLDEHNIVKSWTPAPEDMVTVDWFSIHQGNILQYGKSE